MSAPLSLRAALRQGSIALAGLSASAAPGSSWRSSAPPQPSELLIRGGRVVNADGQIEADVRVVGETIAELGTSLRAGAGARVIDARGMFVIPGGIDPHTHLQPAFVDDLANGSRAALAGGITTIGTFASARRGGERLRRLDVTFPPEVPTHSTRQRFYFSEALELRRHDYDPAAFASWARAAHYCEGYSEADGFRFPTRRRVVPRKADGVSVTFPTLVWIELAAVSYRTSHGTTSSGH